MDLHHPILREFPEHRETIRRLKGSDDHFRNIFDEYHRLDDEIYRIEEEIDFATDQEIEELKMRRAKLKDYIYHLIRHAPAACPTCEGTGVAPLIRRLRICPLLPARRHAQTAYSATTFAARLCAARLRWTSFRIFLRRRRFFGVASTYSSGPMYSRARSSDILSGGLSWMPLPSPCERMLVSFFALHGIDRDVVFARVFADDHAGVNRVARLDHQAAALLDHVQRVGHRLAALHADQRAVLARGDFAAVRAVFVEQMAHHAQAAGLVDQVGLEADQARASGSALRC